uniref:Exocyst complex component 2 n=1 Tax=Rhabditophanes sp. KR3021 TaxID=114890 RepID=A0AC35TML4_9BILA
MDETNDQTGVPQITGISPKEGTPGTTVTLRGEHLGTEQSDLLGLFICGTDCLVSAKWKSTSKIIARLGQAKRGLGEIVLITKSGGKGVSNVQFRVFIEQVQPLQDSSVWVDESRTVPGRNVVRQVQENTDTTDALGFPLNKNTEDHTYLTKLFPESSGNLRMENFNASWYLLEHHKNSSIEQLREGQRNMKAKMISEEKKGKDMHKANLYSLINCVDAVDSLHAKLKIERNTRGWPLTNNLNDKGEYTAILNDYTRVKALFKDTDVSLFNEAMAVVDEKIRKISNTVKHKLIEAPTSFEEQSKLIKFLKYRDPDSDPAYDAIAAYHVWLEDIFWQIQDKYYTMAMEEYEQQKNGISLSDSISSNYLTIANTRQQFCVELMNVLTDKLQMFFKLSQDYVTTNDKEYTKKQENIYQMIFNNINTVSWLLCNALCPQFLPGDIRKSMAKDFVQWPADLHVISVANQATQLINSLKPIRVCIKTFQDASFANGQLEPLMELCTTIRVYSFNEIIQSTCSKIVALNSQETWKTDVVYDQMTKTSLPDLFENEIYDVLPMMKQLISCDNYEGEKDLSLDEKYKTIVLELLLSTVVSIKECYIAMLQLKSNQENKRPNHLQLAGNRELNGSFSSLQSDSMDNRSTGSSDTVNQSSTTISFAGSSNLSSRKMLICICNLDYIATHSLATICKRFRDNGIKYTELILEKAKTRLLNFRQSLLKFYLSLKMSTFSNLLTVNAYDLPPEDDVSSYVKEIIIGMVFIKADLVLLAPQIIVPLMERAVKECTDKLFGLISEFQITSEDFACQLVIDLTGIEEAFQEFLDLQTKSNLNAMRANLVGRFDQTKFQRCLKRWRSNMAMAVAGLQSAEFVEDEANI